MVNLLELVQIQSLLRLLDITGLFLFFSIFSSGPSSSFSPMVEPHTSFLKQIFLIALILIHALFICRFDGDGYALYNLDFAIWSKINCFVVTLKKKQQAPQ